MGSLTGFDRSALYLDADRETERISEGIRRYLTRFRRKGVVVAMSGGVDSSVVAALCVRALGRERVVGLFLPERESSSDTLQLGKLMAERVGITTVLEDISPALDSVGCYARRDEAIRGVCPDFGPGYKAKLVLPSLFEGDRYRLYSVVILRPDGKTEKHRLTTEAYLGVVAATNFKQRIRKMIEYYHADRLNFAVAGTPNRLEYDQGFFVKLGDGAADLKPIAHLYKTQVYQLASVLGVPDEIVNRVPTTDTYTLAQTQEEFYFCLPYEKLDLCLYGMNNRIPAEEVAAAVSLTVEQVMRVFRDIEQKRRTTAYLHRGPELAAAVPEVGGAG